MHRNLGSQGAKDAHQEVEPHASRLELCCRVVALHEVWLDTVAASGKSDRKKRSHISQKLQSCFSLNSVIRKAIHTLSNWTVNHAELMKKALLQLVYDWRRTILIKRKYAGVGRCSRFLNRKKECTQQHTRRPRRGREVSWDAFGCRKLPSANGQKRMKRGWG